jgi:alpha-L-arabinofuranosidase
MTRREEIEKVAMEYASPMTEKDEMLKYDAFKSGAKWADTYPVHYDGKAYIYVLNKGVEQGRREMLDEVCEWLDKNIPVSDLENEHYVVFTEENKKNFIKDCKKSMNEWYERNRILERKDGTTS